MASLATTNKASQNIQARDERCADRAANKAAAATSSSSDDKIEPKRKKEEGGYTPQKKIKILYLFIPIHL